MKEDVTKSASGWESSYFGGYSRLIWDFPYVRTNSTVQNKQGKPPKSMSWYASDKLLNMFLLKVNEQGLNKILLANATRRVDTSWFGVKKITRIVSTKSSVNKTLSKLINKETELGPLFDHYKDFIITSVFEIEIPDEDKDNSGGDQQGEEQSADEKSIEAAIQELGDTVESQRYGSGTGTLSKFNKKTKFKTQSTRGIETSYTGDEVQTSENLLKMLDITWEPDKDIVKSLKMGKLDTGKLAEVLGGNTNIYERDVEDQTTKPFSVCILCDESGSMMDGGIGAQYHIVKSLYLTFKSILPPERLYIYGHTGFRIPSIYTYHDPYSHNFDKTIDNMVTSRELMSNYDGPVIEAIHKKVREHSDEKILFIILSDGNPCGEEYGGADDIDEMKRILEKCRRDDFITAGVGIQHFAVPGLYTYNTVVDNLSDMPKKVSHLLNKIVKTEFQ